MHEAVLGWIAQFRTTDALAVLDIGGRDLNGNLKAMFPNAAPYDVLDLRPAPDVTIVADASEWVPTREYDLVVCTEVFEHTPLWDLIMATAWCALRPGGWLVGTCAGPGRAPHSGIEATTIQPGEYYANVEPAELREVLIRQGWIEIEVHTRGADVQWVAIKPKLLNRPDPPGAPEVPAAPTPEPGAGWCAPSAS